MKFRNKAGREYNYYPQKNIYIYNQITADSTIKAIGRNDINSKYQPSKYKPFSIHINVHNEYSQKSFKWQNT